MSTISNHCQLHKLKTMRTLLPLPATQVRRVCSALVDGQVATLCRPAWRSFDHVPHAQQQLGALQNVERIE
jgi:hypothetical protein